MKSRSLQITQKQLVKSIRSHFKKYGDWRLCDDYHGLNANTIPDHYLLPFLTDYKYLHGKTIFSTIDFIRVYQQTPINEADIPKTTIITPFCLFEFYCMTLGLCNATQTFQRFINTMLSGLDFVFWYIDDILIASPDTETHKKIT